MMKRLAVACALALAFIGHAYAVGSISLSLSQQFNSQGKPLSGGLLYFFQSGTTTPQSAFQDQALTIPYPNPITLDASGRVPAFYLADGNIKIRLTDSTGVTVIAADGLLVIGPSLGSGGGGSVDPTTILATGDVKARYGTGSLAGFVRLNGRTIGSAASGATERANADAQALFEYLWTNDAVNLTVSGGRGATANADWLANKTISLPDMRGRTIAGMDDMGSSAASRLTTSWFGAIATILGVAGGNEFTQLASANQLPSHTHSVSGNTGIESVDHNHSWGGTFSTSTDGLHTHDSSAGISGAPVLGSGAAFGTPGQPLNTSAAGAHSHSVTVGGSTGGISVNHSHAFSVTSGATGASVGFRTMAPAMVMTIYQKL